MITPNNSYYNKKNRRFANILRKRMTKAEACLWKYALRAGKMKGYTFRRQRPVLYYIADFMCLKLKLVIEVDGITHLDETVQLKDLKKQGDLEAAGFKVLRFTDEQVLNNMNGVIDEIELWIDKLENASTPFTSPASGGKKPPKGWTCYPANGTKGRGNASLKSTPFASPASGG